MRITMQQHLRYEVGAWLGVVLFGLLFSWYEGGWGTARMCGVLSAAGCGGTLLLLLLTPAETQMRRENEFPLRWQAFFFFVRLVGTISLFLLLTLGEYLLT